MLLLTHVARKLYRDEQFSIELDETIYALDSSPIDLCFSVFPWAKYRKIKGAIKLHTLLGLKDNILAFIKIIYGKIRDINILDELIPEPGSFNLNGRIFIVIGCDLTRSV